MKRSLVLLIGFLCTFSALAQVEFEERYEQEHDWSNNSYLVVSNEKEGLLLVQADFDAGSKTYPIYFKHLNTKLEKVWQDSISVPNRFFLKGYFYSEKKTYLMLQNNLLTNIKVVRIDALNHKVDEFESKEIAELIITEFEVIKNTAIIGGYFETRPVVFAYEMEHNKVRTLQNVYQNESELVEVRINKDSLTFNVLATVKNENHETTIMVNTYDYVGNAIRDYRLQTKPDYELVNGVSSSINDITQVVVGLYSYRTDHSVSGIYVNHVDRTGTQTMTYYNFGELPHFLDFMGEKRADKQKAKARSMKEAGKEHRYKSEVLFREMIEKDGKIIINGEFFKLYSSSANFNRSNGLNRFGYANNIDRLSGYPAINQTSTRPARDNDLTHAYTLVLSAEGKILWDDYMKIDEDIEGKMTEMGHFLWLGEKASYMYYRDEELFLKILDGSGEREQLVTGLKLLNEGDEVKVEKGESLGSIRWFDNHYLIYGIQHIKSEDKSLPLRKVFFINKVSVSDSPTASHLD